MADQGIFKSAGMKRASARDAQASKGKQFGIGNFFGWAMKKYPKLTLGQLELKMPSLEREYAQEKAMRKAEPEMKPSVNPHEGADLNRLRELSGITEDVDMPSKAHIEKMCKDGKSKKEICDMHPDCDQSKLKTLIDDCSEHMEEGKIPAGLKAYQDKKNGKKDDADKDEDKEVDEDKDEVAESFARMRQLAGLPINEDDVTKVAVGHVDAEADMLRKELFKIGKYSVELYKMLGELPDGDFPHWWQAKIVKAGEYIGSAKHYLEGELYAPEDQGPIEPEDNDDINPSGI